MGQERRESPRHVAALPAQIETDSGRYTIAVTQDVSASGLLVLSHQKLDVGSGVTVYVAVDGVQHVVSGKVVREEPLSHEDAAMWRAKSAVAVDANDPELPKVVAAIRSAKP